MFTICLLLANIHDNIIFVLEHVLLSSGEVRSLEWSVWLRSLHSISDHACRIEGANMCKQTDHVTGIRPLTFAIHCTSMAILDVPWTLTPGQILEHFGVDAGTGLSEDRARKHADIYGRNGRSYTSPTVTHRHLMSSHVPQSCPMTLQRPCGS